MSAPVRKNQRRIYQLTQQKLEILNRVRELRAEIGRINIDLHRAGASIAIINMW